MKIIYKSEHDGIVFDKTRYLKSLNRYGKVTTEQVDEALEEFEGNDVLFYGVLVEKGVQMLLENGGEAERYFEEHKFDNSLFYRLVRLTGYLTESFERINDAKKAEIADRVVHGRAGKDGVYSLEEKASIKDLKLAYAFASQM